MRVVVPIKRVAPYIGSKSASATYSLIKKDSRFAALFFQIQGRTVAFEDQLIAYAEDKARTAQLFAPKEPPKRRRGRPRKQPASQAAE